MSKVQGPVMLGVLCLEIWIGEFSFFLILSPWDMIDYITWGGQTITAIICLILMCCLKCMIFWNKYSPMMTGISKSFSCLLLIWRVKFLAVFTFSSQWLHMKCFDCRSCRHFSDSICFFILRFYYYVCLQWLHLYYFFLIELKLVNRNLKTI